MESPESHTSSCPVAPNRTVALLARAAATALALAALLATGVLSQATPADDTSLYTRDELAAIFRHSPVPPPPADPTNRFANDARAAAFGQVLFFDKHLSPSGEISCATCHQPQHAFTDGRALAMGLAIGTRHTPTILGAAYNQWYFWDGRTDSQWSQALEPFENPREFGSDRRYVVESVKRDASLRTSYERIFGPFPSFHERLTLDRAYSNLGKAIEAYERKLVVGNSPFDRYVSALRVHDRAGERIISPAAKRGLKLFAGAANCELCHSGPDFTDGQFHNIGLPLMHGEVADSGRAEGIRLLRADPFNGIGAFSDDRTGSVKDRLSFLPAPKSQLGAFKTPSLRNVARIGPYMHDGRFTTLAQVLAFYAEGKSASRGRLEGTREETLDVIPHLTGQQQADLVAFLRTLSDPPLPLALREPPKQ
ncbi:MAG TPA: cytochrome c peroxidase [Candidatus Acidoferrales bacterium]|nr:cytochrome c peroxidase [Candidatus Acidoferrales bacterium]